MTHVEKNVCVHSIIVVVHSIYFDAIASSIVKVPAMCGKYCGGWTAAQAPAY